MAIELYCGDVTKETDSRILGADFVSCVELIEHINPEHHDGLVKTIFDDIKPKTALITTPNFDFNVHFPQVRDLFVLTLKLKKPLKSHYHIILIVIMIIALNGPEPSSKILSKKYLKSILIMKPSTAESGCIGRAKTNSDFVHRFDFTTSIRKVFLNFKAAIFRKKSPQEFKMNYTVDFNAQFGQAEGAYNRKIACTIKAFDFQKV